MLVIWRRSITLAAVAAMLSLPRGPQSLSFAIGVPIHGITVGQDAPPPQDDDAAQDDGSATDDGLADLIRHREEEAERAKRWKPITDFGDPEPMVGADVLAVRQELEFRAKERRYSQQLAKLNRRYFRSPRNTEARKEGLEQLGEFTDAAAFRPMIEEFARAEDDVRLAILDHFSQHGEQGQGALAWTAIYSTDPALRNEAQKRMVVPVSDPVKLEMELALRSSDNDAITHAGTLAGALSVLEAIPLLIYTQATTSGGDRTQGDLAWIAIQTQNAYVQDLQPVVGDGSAGFEPVIGIISDGSVLRVVDAVAIMYRTEIHYVLNGLVNRDFREVPDDLGYDPYAWTEWYNSVYVPYKNEQAEIEALADKNDNEKS